jgi:hypothetical protein
MPRPTKAETKSDLIYTAEGLLAASLAFEDDPDIEAMALFQDQEAYEADLADDTSDLLDISALMWLEIVERMDGDGARGPYDKIPKSADFFFLSLFTSTRPGISTYWGISFKSTVTCHITPCRI